MTCQDSEKNLTKLKLSSDTCWNILASLEGQTGNTRGSLFEGIRQYNAAFLARCHPKCFAKHRAADVATHMLHQCSLPTHPKMLALSKSPTRTSTTAREWSNGRHHTVWVDLSSLYTVSDISLFDSFGQMLHVVATQRSPIWKCLLHFSSQVFCKRTLFKFRASQLSLESSKEWAPSCCTGLSFCNDPHSRLLVGAWEDNAIPMSQMTMISSRAAWTWFSCSWSMSSISWRTCSGDS